MGLRISDGASWLVDEVRGTVQSGPAGSVDCSLGTACGLSFTGCRMFGLGFQNHQTGWSKRGLVG